MLTNYYSTFFVVGLELRALHAFHVNASGARQDPVATLEAVLAQRQRAQLVRRLEQFGPELAVFLKTKHRTVVSTQSNL